MNIGISTTKIEPDYTHGQLDGIGIYTTHLRDGYLARGHTVTGISYPSLTGSKSKMSVGKPFSIPYPVGAASSILTNGLLRYKCDADIFHVTDYMALPMNCPVVATLYDAIPLKHPEMVNSRLRWIKNYVMKSAASYADHIIAISQYSVAELVEYYKIPESRISVIHCGVDSEWLEPVSAENIEKALQKYHLQAGYFLFVGTLQPRKNLSRVLDAYYNLPASVREQRKLVVVGRAGWGCDEILQRLEQLQVQGDIIWLNHVTDKEELRYIYSAAGVFVFPSLYEGFGLPVLEAFACRVPVITSSTTSLPEASGGAALEVNPESVDEISAAMELLAENSDQREKYVELGFIRAQKMTWDATVEQTLDLYRELL